jgi:hypothetical protein
VITPEMTALATAVKLEKKIAGNVKEKTAEKMKVLGNPRLGRLT